MIRARALAELFTDNVGETAKSIFLCTTGGHLVGKDDAAPNSTTKQLACLGALGWRVNTAIMRGEDPSRAARTQSPKTLKQVEKKDQRSLKTLVFELDSHAIALECVREGLLAGVCGFKMGEGGEGNGKEAALEEDGEDGEETEGEEDGRDDESDAEEKKMSVLEEKAEALAEYLREELKHFRIPSSVE